MAAIVFILPAIALYGDRIHTARNRPVRRRGTRNRPVRRPPRPRRDLSLDVPLRSPRFRFAMGWPRAATPGPLSASRIRARIVRYTRRPGIPLVLLPSLARRAVLLPSLAQIRPQNVLRRLERVQQIRPQGFSSSGVFDEQLRQELECRPGADAPHSVRAAEVANLRPAQHFFPPIYFGKSCLVHF